MRISDWSSDVCSSDLLVGPTDLGADGEGQTLHDLRRPFQPEVGDETADAVGALLAEAGGERHIVDGERPVGSYARIGPSRASLGSVEQASMHGPRGDAGGEAGAADAPGLVPRPRLGPPRTPPLPGLQAAPGPGTEREAVVGGKR